MQQPKTPGGQPRPIDGGRHPSAREAQPSRPGIVTPDRQPARGYGETFGSGSFSGEVSFSLPLPAADARLVPGLTLDYTHGGVNGPFGLGMALSLPTIVRRTDTGIPRYNQDDIFLGPDGQALAPGMRADGQGGWMPEIRRITQDGVAYTVRRYRARTGDNRSRIEQWLPPEGNPFWTVRDPDNGVTVFGKSGQARIADPVAAWRIAVWLPEEQIDAHGNRLVFLYKPEDLSGWTGAPLSAPAQRYLSEIRYGNYGQEGSEAFAFSMIFDYGEYDPLSGKADPIRPWPIRSDPLTSCRTGFPVQTLRLCHGVFSVNRLPEACQPGPLVDEVLRFDYSDPSDRKLTAITLTGQRWASAGQLSATSLPPLVLAYAAFEPSIASWRPLAIAGTEQLPGCVDGGQLSFADLDGEGLPGIVFTADGTLSYAPPLGDGRYGALLPLPVLPDPVADASFALRDLDGNGRLSLTAMTSEWGGYFHRREDGTWEGFKPFSAYAPEAASAAAQWVDLDGDGLADILVSTPNQTRVYLSRGSGGFAPALSLAPATTDPEFAGAAVLRTFADMLGDGLAHRVQVQSGRVQVRPNLGYGRFGAAFDWPNAPAFGPEIDPGRILLGNIRGTGAADLLLVHPDHIALYPNLGIAGFGPAKHIALPCLAGPDCSVTIADLRGNGRGCLVITLQGANAATWFIDLCGDAFPGLLDVVDNGMGGSTRLGYRSSTDFYLADRARGQPWLSRLAMPVVVIERLEHIDAVTGLVCSEQHQYRDGYFDPVERRFRGFGLVQSINTRARDEQLWHYTRPPSPAEILSGPAQLVKSWFYTGAFVSPEAEVVAYRPGFFAGDAEAPAIAASYLEPPLRAHNADTVRDATASLAGTPIRSETYSVDVDGSTAAVPLEVEAHSQTVVLLQPHMGTATACVLLVPRESASLFYDGMAHDPRIEHDAILQWDAYGNPQQSVNVFYPRRVPQTPAQGELRMTAQCESYIDLDDDTTFLIGLPCQSAEYELVGLTPADGRYFTYETLKNGVAVALADPISYGQPFDAGLQARLFRTDRSYYWTAEQTGPAPLGQTGPQALLHHKSHAVFPESYVAAVYGANVTQAMLTDEAALTLERDLWWSADPITYYADATGYYQPIGLQTPFQTDKAHTVIAYDPYWLFVTRWIDSLGYATVSSIDYQALEPDTVTDENGMSTQGLYNPLKLLIVVSQHAMVNGAWRGGMDLANYRPQPTPDLATLTADPLRFLQGAAGYFLPGYDAWSGTGSQPAFLAAVQAMANVDSPDWHGSGGAEPAIHITRQDGFGHPLEALERVETVAVAEPWTSNSAWTWHSATRVDYDNQGRILRDYLPTFQDGTDFQPVDNRPFTAFQYDALDRRTRTDTAKGFILLTRYLGGWVTQYADADDTVLQSAYYQTHIHDPKLPAAERRALKQAAGFADTPTTHQFDAQGNVVRVDTINTDAAGNHFTLSSTITLDIRGLTCAAVDPRLSATPGLDNVNALYDMQERPIKVSCADSGVEMLLRDSLGETIYHWGARGDRIRTQYDKPIRRPTQILLAPQGNAPETEIANFAYGTDPAAQTVNRLVLVRDQAGVGEISSYDIGGRTATSSRQFSQAAQGVLDWQGEVALQTVVWQQGWLYGPMGHLLSERCVDGSQIQLSYFSNGWLSQSQVQPAGGADPIGVLQRLRYDPSAQIAVANYGERLTLAWRYDPLTGELTSSLATTMPAAQVVQNLSYTYDPQGNVASLADEAAAALMGGPAQTLQKDFSFDALYQLTGATGWEQAQTTPPWSIYSQTLSYDKSGNLTAVAPSGGALAMTVSSTSNRAVASCMLHGGATVEQFFDTAGNLQALADGTALAYDFDQRLISVTPPGQSAPSAYYRYDSDGVRLRKSLAGNSDIYHLGSSYIESEQGRTRISLLVPGMHGDKLFFSPNAGSQQPNYLLTDRVGSVVGEFNADGSLARVQNYYPYGGLSVEQPCPSTPELPARLTFSGKERDSETGLSYFGGRYYISAWGRWLTPDPMGHIDGLNLFRYVSGNPVSHTDPNGFVTTRSGKKTTAPRGIQRRGRKTKAATINMTVKSRLFYGSSSKFNTKGFGGSVLKVTSGGKSGVLAIWTPKSGNTGKDITRAYPITSKGYRQLKIQAWLRQRKQRSMFKNADKTSISYVRGHLIPHADTLANTPLSGGLLSTKDASNYYPEPEGWGEQQRKHREGKGRNRETPLIHYNEFSSTSGTTVNGALVPDRLWFVELTGWSKDHGYSSSKSYNIKAYAVDYKTFDYDSMPYKNTSDRRKTKPLRTSTLPQGLEDLIRKETGITTKFIF